MLWATGAPPPIPELCRTQLRVTSLGVKLGYLFIPLLPCWLTAAPEVSAAGHSGLSYVKAKQALDSETKSLGRHLGETLVLSQTCADNLSVSRGALGTSNDCHKFLI